MTCECEVRDDTGVRWIKLCPLHDGSMEKLLAEALKEMIKHHERGYGPLTRGMRDRFDTMLRDYEAKAGK